VTAWVVEDALNDLALWRICVNRATPIVESHQRLQRSLGAPFRVEPWWNGSVTTRGKGNLASCVYLVDGERASCDVQVVLVREPTSPTSGFSSLPNLFRNLAAPDQWRVVRMEAILPHEKKVGLPGRVNLLQEAEPKGGILETQKKGGKRKKKFLGEWEGRWWWRSRPRNQEGKGEDK
jgi:hypothetical protein